LELLQVQCNISVPASPLSDDQATALLRSLIFHWDAIPRTAQFVYRIHCIWCGKGWSDPVEVVPVDLFTLADDVESDEDFDQIDGLEYFSASDIEEGS
jgi:hypothetical protein